MPKIEKINDYLQTIPAGGEQKVPINFHLSEKLLPNEETINQLIEVAKDPHIFHHISAMTDVHQKPGRKSPSGSVVATKGYFLPQINDTAPNCGMRMIATPFSQDNLSEKQIDLLFQALTETIPTKTYIGTPVSRKTVLEICKRGSEALLEDLNEDKAEIERTFMNGNMFGEEKITNKDLFGALPRMFFRIAQLRLGILGAAGNHFLDLLKVEDILEPEIAQKFNLKKNQYVFLLHTGSGLFGQYASYFYTPKQKEHLSQKIVLELSRLFFLDNKIDWHRTLEVDLPRYKDKKEFFAIDSESELGKNFYIAHRAAANHGFANRTMLQAAIKNTIKETLKIKDPKLEVIYDMTHVYAQKEHHFGEETIVHRSNATRAFGPERMKGVKLYEETGEPVFLPSSMSTPVYFGVGTDENEATFFSAAHGTGKAKDAQTDASKTKEELLEKMKSRKVKLYNAKSKGVINQDAGYYKDVEAAIEGMKANKIMKPVAKMMPVAVLMY